MGDTREDIRLAENFVFLRVYFQQYRTALAISIWTPQDISKTLFQATSLNVTTTSINFRLLRGNPFPRRIQTFDMQPSMFKAAAPSNHKILYERVSIGNRFEWTKNAVTNLRNQGVHWQTPRRPVSIRWES